MLNILLVMVVFLAVIKAAVMITEIKKAKKYRRRTRGKRK